MSNPIKHVIVLALENRSFDHMLGYSFPSPIGLAGTESNPDVAGGVNVTVSPTASATLRVGPGHSHDDALMQLKGPTKPFGGITNRGFVESFARVSKGSGHEIMRCFDPSLVPVLGTLAREFAVCSNWFCSVPGETWPNRNYLHAATSDGEVNIKMRPYWRRTIFELLKDAGHEWLVYHRGPAQVWAFPRLWQLPFSRHHRYRKLADLPADIRSGKMPAYVFVEPDHGLLFRKSQSNSQHPGENEKEGRNFYAGERLIFEIYRALIDTPALFNETLFVITYDEHGGFYDHVPPPEGVPPAVAPDKKSKKGFHFDLLGPRVPTVLISPWIKARTLDQEIYDHSAVPASLKELFAPAVGHLTARDAVSKTFWRNLSLSKPRGVNEVPTADDLMPGLNDAAVTTTGDYAADSVDPEEPATALDEIQENLFELALRVDAAGGGSQNEVVSDERVELAFAVSADQLVQQMPTGALSMDSALSPDVVSSLSRAEYLQDMERRFRGE